MSIQAGSTRWSCSPRQREPLTARCRGPQHILGATGEVCVGLNQGRIPSGSRWSLPDVGRSYGRSRGLERGEESPAFPPPYWPGPRIVNSQLIRYAGYPTVGGGVFGDPANVDITLLARVLGWPGTRPRGRFHILPLIVQEADALPTTHELPH
jgi:hypothetical protein